MKKNIQEERFELFKQRSLSTNLFLRLFFFRNLIGLSFLGMPLIFLITLRVDKEFIILYKTHFEETKTIKTNQFEVSQNYHSRVNGRTELIFKYSFDEDDKIFEFGLDA